MKVWLSGINGAGQYTEVDPVDFQRVSQHKWFLRNGYAVSVINGRTVRLHRFVMNEDDPRIVIDHINRDRLDNRAENLRPLTPIENANNRVDNVRVTAWGEVKTIAEWCRDDRCIAPYGVLQKLIYRGIPPELAILGASYES